MCTKFFERTNQTKPNNQTKLHQTTKQNNQNIKQNKNKKTLQPPNLRLKGRPYASQQ